jgi:hypothetical protein
MVVHLQYGAAFESCWQSLPRTSLQDEDSSPLLRPLPLPLPLPLPPSALETTHLQTVLGEVLHL